jgi:hypothetical protein
VDTTITVPSAVSPPFRKGGSDTLKNNIYKKRKHLFEVGGIIQKKFINSNIYRIITMLLINAKCYEKFIMIFFTILYIFLLCNHKGMPS